MHSDFLLFFSYSDCLFLERFVHNKSPRNRPFCNASNIDCLVQKFSDQFLEPCAATRLHGSPWRRFDWDRHMVKRSQRMWIEWACIRTLLSY